MVNPLIYGDNPMFSFMGGGQHGSQDRFGHLEKMVKRDILPKIDAPASVIDKLYMDTARVLMERSSVMNPGLAFLRQFSRSLSSRIEIKRAPTATEMAMGDQNHIGLSVYVTVTGIKRAMSKRELKMDKTRIDTLEVISTAVKDRIKGVARVIAENRMQLVRQSTMEKLKAMDFEDKEAIINDPESDKTTKLLKDMSEDMRSAVNVLHSTNIRHRAVVTRDRLEKIMKVYSNTKEGDFEK